MRTPSQRLTVTDLAAAVAVLAVPALTPATDYEASDYLPLAVGNSWTFAHGVLDHHAACALGLLLNTTARSSRPGVAAYASPRAEHKETSHASR